MIKSYLKTTYLKKINQFIGIIINTKKIFLFVYFGSDFKDNLMLVIKKDLKKFLLPTLEVIHISDPEKFKKNEQNIKYELAKNSKLFFIY